MGVGVYGMAIEGLPGATALLRPVPPDAPVLRVSHERGEPSLTGVAVGEDRAAYRLRAAGGEVRLDRAEGSATFVMQREYPDEAFVHPFLALAAAIFSRWWGRDALHGGAFVHDGGAWVVLGAREAGKSSLLAQLHRLGVPVLSDDVAVVSDGQVLAGPGSIDLRGPAAQHLGTGTPLGRVGARDRWRVLLPAGPVSAPLRGFVLPSWGGACEVVAVPPLARLPLLMSNTALNRPPVDPQRFFALAAHPALELRRPRDWAQLERSARLLLEQVTARYG